MWRKSNRPTDFDEHSTFSSPFTKIWRGLGLLVLLELLLVCIRQPQFWLSLLLWSISFLAVGGLLGFLFGAPRATPNRGSEPKGKENSTETHSYSVNTSLEEIADWLTKGLIALALVNLKDIPGLLTRLAAYVARGSSPSAVGPPLAAALILNFTLVGFIGGSLLTRYALTADLGS